MLPKRVLPTTRPVARAKVAKGSARPVSWSRSAVSMYRSMAGSSAGTVVKPYVSRGPPATARSAPACPSSSGSSRTCRPSRTAGRTGMGVEPRVVHTLHGGMSLQEAREGEGIRGLPLHAHAQGPRPARGEPCVEGTQVRPRADHGGPHAIHGCLAPQHDAARDISVAR